MSLRVTTIVAAAMGLLIGSASQAASIAGPSIYLAPSSSTVQLSAGTTTLELFMDFTGTPTLGGGIDIDLTGPLSFNSFTPTAYFTGLDSLLSGHGTTHADADYQVHFGDFAGLSGLNKLGDLKVNLTGAGSGAIALAINNYYGPFYDLGAQQMNVALNGAQVNVVPLPATAWMLVTGFVPVLMRAARRRQRA